MLTTQERWNAAVKGIRSQGVKIKQNVAMCCRGCIGYETLGMEQDSTQPYVYTYGGQGDAYRWIEGKPYYRDEYKRRTRKHPFKDARKDTAVSRVYIYHGNQSGEIVLQAFKAAGFDVSWDGTEGTALVVLFT